MSKKNTNRPSANTHRGPWGKQTAHTWAWARRILGIRGECRIYKWRGGLGMHAALRRRRHPCVRELRPPTVGLGIAIANRPFIGRSAPFSALLAVRRPARRVWGLGRAASGEPAACCHRSPWSSNKTQAKGCHRSPWSSNKTHKQKASRLNPQVYIALSPPYRRHVVPCILWSS
jgi:hypothetical protein